MTSGLALVLALTLAPCSARDIVTLTGDPWPPYVTGRLGGEATGGLGVTIIRELFRRVGGVEVRFPLLPWKRALREVEEGTKDGIALLLRTPERELYMVYTEPVIESQSLLWYRSDRFPGGVRWQVLADLARFRIGLTRGYSYGAAIDDAVARGVLTVIEMASVRQVFMMLAHQRVDLALANDAVGYALAAELAD